MLMMLALGACGELTPPHAVRNLGSDVVEVTGIPASSPVSQLGLELAMNVKVPSRVADLWITIDAGTAAARVVRPSTAIPDWTIRSGFNPFWVLGPFSNGAHTFTIAARDSSGVVRDTSFTLTFDVPARTYRVVPIGVPGASAVTVADINNSGMVVGTATVAGRENAFAWADGTATLLGDPSGSVAGTTAAAVNEHGKAVGTVDRTPTVPAREVLVWEGGVSSAPRVLPGWGGRDLNDAGEILTWNAILHPDGSVKQSFAVYGRQYAGTVFYELNASGMAAGSWGNEYRNDGRAGTASPDRIVETPPAYWRGYHYGGHGSALFELNDMGEALGVSDPHVHYFYWRNGTTHWLVNPFADGRAWAINNRSEVVGTTKDGTPYLWTIGGGVTQIMIPGYEVVHVAAINDRGRILARLRGTTGEIEAVLEP